MRKNIQKQMISSAIKMEDRNTNFVDSILKYWPIILTITCMIAGYSTLESNYNTLKEQVNQNTSQINTAQNGVLAANANYAEVAGDIKGINAKLDIIIKHSGL